MPKVQLDEIQRRLIREIADLHDIPVGAYNFRANSKLAGRNTTANIDITSKEDKSGIDIKRYFRPGLTPGQYNNNKQVTAHDLETAISDSVACHMRSDTELGLFLSGGIDSIYLASLAGIEKAFTVGFQEEGYNEADKASRIAERFHMKHYQYLIPQFVRILHL